MLLKKGNIIMLPSNEAAIDLIINDKSIKSFKIGSIVYNPNLSPSLRIVKKDEIYNSEMGFVKVHLYLFVEEDVIEGDFILKQDNEDNIIKRCTQKEINYSDSFYKLIATNDWNYDIARLSRKFLEKYVEKESIDEVFIAYEDAGSKGLIPKVNKNNVIAIKKAKDSFTGIEVVRILKSFMSDVYNNTNKDTALEWIDENI